jgi:hypothetical protein
MRIFLNLVCTILYAFPMLAQEMERKIILKNNAFFYTTIDPEVQIGTLHTGSISDPLKAAKKLALPAGRNYRHPLNPLAWDIADSLVFVVNFLDHPLNNKNRALKCFPLSSLREGNSSITAADMIMKSVDQNMFAYNEPYQFIKHQSNMLNGFQFDGIVLQDSSYVMVIANNNQLSVWNYAHKKWTHGEVQSFVIDGFFTLFEADQQLYIILKNGNVHKVSNQQVAPIPEKVTNRTLNENTLILNKDKHTFQLIKNNELNMQMPFDELIEKKAVSIF